MNVTELSVATLASGDPAAEVKVAAHPANPVLAKILALATVGSAADDPSDGKFAVNLDPISTKFRIRAPYNTALDDLLANANVLGVDTDSEPGVSKFHIDA